MWSTLHYIALMDTTGRNLSMIATDEMFNDIQPFLQNEFEEDLTYNDEPPRAVMATWFPIEHRHGPLPCVNLDMIARCGSHPLNSQTTDILISRSSCIHTGPILLTETYLMISEGFLKYRCPQIIHFLGFPMK